MVPEKLQQQISQLLNDYPRAKPVIDGLLAHFEGTKAAAPSAAVVPPGAVEYTGMSLILPQRRKCSLFVGEQGIHVTFNGLLLLHSPWEAIQRVVLLPITDKTKPSWNLIFAKPDPAETVMVSLGEVSADKFKSGAKPAPLRQELVADIELNSSLTVDKEYSLAVNAHIGSKDGMLFFLQDALVYGYKKPVLVIPHTLISSISFTGITTTTFNIVVELQDETSHEFSVIDEEEYPKISAYIEDRGLDDRSLAADRSAKRRRTDDGASMEGDVAEELEDMDDRESDVDVHFDENDFSGGSGESSEEEDSEDEEQEGEEGEEEEQDEESSEPDVNLQDTSEVNQEIDVAQMRQIYEQQQDEDEEERGFDEMDAYDTNFN